MMKTKRIGFFLMSALTMRIAAPAYGQDFTFTNSQGNKNFADTLNWSPAHTGWTGNKNWIVNLSGLDRAELTSTLSVARNVLVGDTDVNAVGEFWIGTGGGLASERSVRVVRGVVNGSGTLTVDGGSLTVGYELFIGQNPNPGSGVFNLLAGTVSVNNANNQTNSLLVVHQGGGNGTLNISGGSMNASTGFITMGQGTDANVTVNMSGEFNYGHTRRHFRDYPDAVEVYVAALNALPPGAKAKLIIGGGQTNLAELLKDYPEVVRQRVSQLHFMGGMIDPRDPGEKWQRDSNLSNTAPFHTKYVAENWPREIPMFIADTYLGLGVPSMRADIRRQLSDLHPAKRIHLLYRLWWDHPHGNALDLMSVMTGVRGLTNLNGVFRDELADYAVTTTDGRCWSKSRPVCPVLMIVAGPELLLGNLAKGPVGFRKEFDSRLDSRNEKLAIKNDRTRSSRRDRTLVAKATRVADADNSCNNSRCFSVQCCVHFASGA